jgi:DNA-binding GntR family transcriptional regulator
MRTIYDVVDEAEIIDKHQMALDAIRRRDAEALKVAIQADILDGIYLLRRTIPWES